MSAARKVEGYLGAIPSHLYDKKHLSFELASRPGGYESAPAAKNLLTALQRPYTLMSAIHIGRLCCAILRAIQLFPASNLSKGLR
jgi:hypothetical protein